VSAAAAAAAAAGATGAPVPGWLVRLAGACARAPAEEYSRFLPPPEGGRRSAVLVLFGEGPSGPDVLLIERAAEMRTHAGQPAFPGGARDPGDATAAATALREAQEETGLDPAGVEVLAELPDLFLPPSGFVVTPVLGWWRAPSEVGPMDTSEVAAVERVPLAELTAPANRVVVRHWSGLLGPGFRVRGLLVWGFTAGLLARILDLGGLLPAVPDAPPVDPPVTPGARRPR
jgi:8-oxo-dGTP pyrophosphatase MutT (NUDIX family)